MKGSRSLGSLAVIGLVSIAIACGERPSSSQTQTPDNGGKATLSEAGCDFQLRDRLALRPVIFNVVNTTKYSGRFIFARIHEGHTFEELVAHWNGPLGKLTRPDFVTELSLVDIPTNGSGVINIAISIAGAYAFHCGYRDETGTVTGFWHGPMQAGAT